MALPRPQKDSQQWEIKKQPWQKKIQEFKEEKKNITS